MPHSTTPSFVRSLPPLLTYALGLVVFLSAHASLSASEDDIEHFFDGSNQGNAGEASVNRNLGPGYYHFTLAGLSAFQSLESMRVGVIPHERHASRRLNMWVYSSVPSPEYDELPGFDFSLRDETELTYNYYDEDGALIEGDVSGRDINQTGWIEVPVSDLSMENERTFRMAFESGFRGGVNLTY